MKLKLKLVVPAVAALVLALNVVFAPVALADSPPGYDIEVQRITCIDRDDPCNTFATATNSLYTQVTALSDDKNERKGTPDAVNLVCGMIRFEADGPHLIKMQVAAGEKDLGYDGGVIRGTASLAGHPSEQSTHAVATLNIWASDPVFGDWGTVRGRQVTNNVTDTRVSGGFSVELHGNILDFPAGPPPPGAPQFKVIGHGEMECDTFGSSVPKTEYPASGPYYESVINNSDCVMSDTPC